MNKPEIHKCLTCNVRLNVFEEDGVRTYAHAGQSTASDPEFFNHEPVPVPEVEYDTPASTVCDFCSVPNPVWQYAVRPAENALMVFRNPETGDVKTIDYRDNNPDWIACDTCHGTLQSEALVGREQVRAKLAEASLTRMLQVGRITQDDVEYVTPQVAFMHDLFFKNRLGTFTRLPS